MNWEETIQSWGSALLNGAVDREFYQDYNLQRLRLEALGTTGYYTEGQPGRTAPTTPAVTAGGVSPVLLVGGLVLLVLLMKD